MWFQNFSDKTWVIRNTCGISFQSLLTFIMKYIKITSFKFSLSFFLDYLIIKWSSEPQVSLGLKQVVIFIKTKW